MPVGAAQDNRLCFGEPEPVPDPELKEVGARAHLPQVAERRGS
jgi:hypothetical protein